MSVINHPIERFALIKNIIDISLQETTALHKLLLEAKDKPHVLNDNLVNRAISQYQEGLELIPIYENQVKNWKLLKLTEEQSRQILQLENVIAQLKQLYDLAIAHARQLSKQTIDKILAMSDMELALKVLSQEIKF